MHEHLKAFKFCWHSKGCVIEKVSDIISICTANWKMFYPGDMVGFCKKKAKHKKILPFTIIFFPELELTKHITLYATNSSIYKLAQACHKYAFRH